MLHKVSCMAAELTNVTKSEAQLRKQLCTQREAESKAQREADAQLRQCRADLKKIRSQLAAKHSELMLSTAECNRIAEESEMEKNSFEATIAAKTRALEAVANELAELRTSTHALRVELLATQAELESKLAASDLHVVELQQAKNDVEAERDRLRIDEKALRKQL